MLNDIKDSIYFSKSEKSSNTLNKCWQILIEWLLGWFFDGWRKKQGFYFYVLFLLQLNKMNKIIFVENINPKNIEHNINQS